jgi:hypothetical protein
MVRFSSAISASFSFAVGSKLLGIGHRSVVAKMATVS